VMSVALFGVVGCGGDDTTTVGPSTVPPPADFAVPGAGGGDMAMPGGTTPQTVMVMVGPNGTNSFSPSTVTIHPGDTVMWTWVSGLHTVTSGAPGAVDGKFCSNGGA